MDSFRQWRKTFCCCALTVFIGITATTFAKSLEEEFRQRHPLPGGGETLNQPQNLYFEAMELKEKGENVLALVKLSEAYGEENIAVDSYYDMLDRERISILQDIENGAPWSQGAPNKMEIVRSIREQFHTLGSRPDCSIYHVSSGHALPFKWFLNYQIIQTINKKSPVQCLNNPDPWMVSTVLFLAEKGELKVQPENVIRRWERRPDLWNDICTAQTLLYFGTLGSSMLSSLNIQNEDIKMAVQPLVDRAQKSLLLSCASYFNPSGPLLTVDMSIKERVAYESLNRVEISIRNANGREFFRAMNNRSSKCAPIPPNAFGIYPVEIKKELSLRDIKSAGMEAGIPVRTKYGNLVQGCRTSWRANTLNIRWQIYPVGWKFPDGRGDVFVKIVSADKKDAAWTCCGSFAYPVLASISGNAKDKHLEQAIITPQFYYRETGHKVKPGTFSAVTLVTLKQVLAKGVVIRWTGDTPEKYRYIQVSRKSIELGKHKTVSLKPGFYRLEYNDVRGQPSVGFYGKSDVFEVTNGENIVIKIFVGSAV